MRLQLECLVPAAAELRGITIEINSTWNTVDQIAYMAADRKCDYCHGSIVARYDDGHYVPTYNNSMISPLATFKINATIGNGIEWGGCFSCHDVDVNASSALTNPDETHHGARMYEGYQCNNCHVSKGIKQNPIQTVIQSQVRTIIK